MTTYRDIQTMGYSLKDEFEQYWDNRLKEPFETLGPLEEMLRNLDRIGTYAAVLTKLYCEHYKEVLDRG